MNIPSMSQMPWGNLLSKFSNAALSQMAPEATAAVSKAQAMGIPQFNMPQSPDMLAAGVNPGLEQQPQQQQQQQNPLAPQMFVNALRGFNR